jgi:serine/threonine protein kinase
MTMYESQAEIDAFFDELIQFRPVRILGAGSFGVAILVYDEVEQNRKVFKLPRDQVTTDALLLEGNNLRRLEELYHPNIIRLYQLGKVRLHWSGEQQDRYYLNMAYGGTSLRHQLGDLHADLDENGNAIYSGSGRRLSVEDAVRIAVDVCDGLEAAHGFRGAPVRMLHRDISPDNILVDEESGVARLSDFGLSRVIDRSTALVSFGGKLLYMSPECARGQASVQSDVYSLGIVLYEMLTGQLPFSGFHARLEGSPRPPRSWFADIPEELNTITMRCLENDLDKRYKSAGELLRELRHVAASLQPIPQRYTKLGSLETAQWLCEDAETGERVAVRIACTTASLVEFAHQCNRLEELNDDRLEIPLRHFQNEQFIGIVSRPPRGRALADFLRPGGCRSLDEIAAICNALAGACEVLEPLHQHDACHGLLSPSCIAIETRGVRLYDLGTNPILRARRIAGSSPESMAYLDKALPYMSPQLIAATRDPSAADDVYSLGAILFNLLSGRAPLDDDERRQLLAGATVVEPGHNLRARNRLVPPALAILVAKSLYFNPQDRFQNAKEFGAALGKIRLLDDCIAAMIQDALEKGRQGGPSDRLDACQILEEALGIAPGNVHVHRARGELYLLDGAYRYAVEEFEKVSRILPSHGVFDLLGQSYARWNKPEQAIDAYQKAIHHEENMATMDRLARELRKAGRADEAAEMMRRSIDREADPSLKERRRLILRSWESGESSVPQEESDEPDGPTDLAKTPPHHWRKHDPKPNAE